MTQEQRLTILKHNIQRPHTTANDVLLTHLLQAGEAAIRREGIIDDGADDYENCVIDYAAYLFRKRDNDTGMPRHLRWQLNNILTSQKIKAAQDDV